MSKFDIAKDRSAVNGMYQFSFVGDAIKAIVPVLQCRHGRYRLVGTATYFGAPDWFITAGHIFQGKDIDKSDDFAVHFDGTAEPARFDQVFLLSDTDIAICRLGGRLPGVVEHLTPFAVMNLSPEVHEIVATFGFAHSLVKPDEVYETRGERFQSLLFRSKWELGGVLAIHPTGRGALKSEIYETSMLAEGRDSGAPVFNSNGFLIGVISSSFTFEDGLPNSSVSSIRDIGGKKLDGLAVDDIWYKGQRLVSCRKT